MTRLRSAALAAALLLGTLPARAADLAIGYADPVSSLDPQLNNFPGDRSADLFFWDFLVINKEDRLQPDLAVAWKPLDATTWEFKLRPGVLWHDGQPFTADDVIFSYARARSVPGSAAGFGGYLRTTTGVTAADPLTLIIQTRTPTPDLPRNVASVHIVSRHVGEHAAGEDYNAGRAVVGTGPYVFVSYVPGDRLVARRNDSYWGPRPVWDKVTFRQISNPAARSAALLAGDVDVIDKVSIADLGKMAQAPGLRLFPYPGLRVLLLEPNYAAPTSPFVTDNAGKPLEHNPLLEPRVRRALDVAINRKAIVERLLQGAATEANQWMPKGSVGFDPALKDIPYDPAEAKRLLTEAGYPDGFKLTLHAPSDRTPQGEVAQAIGQFWTRVGVRTQVEGVPDAVYSSRAQKGEFPLVMIAWGNGTGEASYALVNVLATVNAAAGYGAVNAGRYSNKQADSLLERITSEFDEQKREALMHEAAEVVMGETGILPLFHFQNVWAARKGLIVRPITSDRTAPQMVTPE